MALRSCVGGWVLGGEWNISPESLRASKWLDLVGGVIFATTLPTCNDNTYDFFVVHRSLAHAVVGVQRIEDGGCNPHWFTRLLLRGDARRLAVRKIIKPSKVEAVLPFGPQRLPPDYSQVFKLASEVQTLDTSMLEWLRASRCEWNDLACDSKEFKPAKFIWTSACGQRAQRSSGASAVSIMWRALARRAQDISRSICRGSLLMSVARTKAVAGHLEAAVAASRTLCKSQQAMVAPQVTKWAGSLRAAVTQTSLPWLASLTKIADMKAKIIEDATSHSRLAVWKSRLGAVTS